MLRGGGARRRGIPARRWPCAHCGTCAPPTRHRSAAARLALKPGLTARRLSSHPVACTNRTFNSALGQYAQTPQEKGARRCSARRPRPSAARPHPADAARPRAPRPAGQRPPARSPWLETQGWGPGWPPRHPAPRVQRRPGPAASCSGGLRCRTLTLNLAQGRRRRPAARRPPGAGRRRTAQASARRTPRGAPPRPPRARPLRRSSVRGGLEQGLRNNAKQDMVMCPQRAQACRLR